MARIWWPVPDNGSNDLQSMSIYHEGARLGPQRAGLLIDTGARGNLSGDAWVQEQAKLAKEVGNLASQERMSNPFNA
eukprot:7524477-Lingulodinium_polyedra.AAC.1